MAEDQWRHNLWVGSLLIGILLAIFIGGVSGSPQVGMLVFCGALIGAAVLIDRRKRPSLPPQVRVANPDANPTNSPSAPSGPSIKDRLKQLDGLKEDGLISDAEYIERLNHILGQI